MLSAIQLMARKGYKGVSTKEIAAAAGVSEMTLFRHFGSKLNLLSASVDRYHYSGMMESIEGKLVWDLRKDLHLIARNYHEMMNRNRNLFLIVLRDDDLTDLREEAQKQPRQLKEALTSYFKTMQETNKLITSDPEALAVTFMWMNYGAFISSLLGGGAISDVTTDRFLDSSVELFARGLEKNA